MKALLAKRADLITKKSRLDMAIRSVELEIRDKERKIAKDTGFPADLPVTASDWELFTSSMKCDGCAKRLTAALKKNLLRFKRIAGKVGPQRAAYSCYDVMREKLAKESKYGASDSEPQYHMTQAIIDYGRMLGYDMQGHWF